MDDKELIFIDALISHDASGAIERSEKREQQSAVLNQRIPIKSNDNIVPWEIMQVGVTDDMEWEKRFKIEADNNKKWTKVQYEKMGIKILGEYNDLFFNVLLPEGWEVKPTDHSLWNEVTDNKGRKRISFFYKGVFYDRNAFSNFVERYTYSIMPFDEYKTDASYEERQVKEWYGIVYDSGQEIFRTKGIIKEDYFDDSLQNQCLDYLKEKFPLFKDFNAYWND